MKPDPDYPRMLFHRKHPAVTVRSALEEKALGPDWSRTIPAPEPPKADAPAEAPAEELITPRVQLEALRIAARRRRANR